MDVSTNTNLHGFETYDVSKIAKRDIEDREELVKRIRDTFRLTKDSFEKIPEQAFEVCGCYEKYHITTKMPESVFGDSFGYAMQDDIYNRMKDYYAGKMSDGELKQYFNDCCADMRIYRAQKHQSSGNEDADNMQIVSQIYEIFAKQNVRAASNANYEEGAAVNASYGDEYIGNNWAYYNAKYYYQCEDVKKFLGDTANEVAEKWGIGTVDTQKIEENSKYTLDGRFDFNSVWNFHYRNQSGNASIADEGTQPPKDLRFFYKGGINNTAKMDVWMGEHKKRIAIPFYDLGESLKGQIYNADGLMKDFYEKSDRAKEYSDFMKQVFVFTRRYAKESGIINRFGNLVPETY